LIVLTLAGAAVTPGETDEKPGTPAPYRLRPGDELAVSVLPQKEYDCTGVVLPDGVVTLRHVGTLVAAGRTLAEIEGHVLRVLGKELVDPMVTISLVRLAPEPAPAPVAPGRVTVVGGVLRAGPLDLEPGLRLRKALDLAGGAAPGADLKNVVIYHRNLTRTVVDLSLPERVIDPAHNRLLEDGDSVEVPLLPPPAPTREERPTVRITGQVNQPGRRDLAPGMDLEDLIVQAGKLSALADVERIELRRGREPVRVISLTELRKRGAAGRVALEDGDDVHVPEAPDRVFLVGALANPGPRPLRRGESLREFLLASGDLAVLNPAITNLKAAELIRRGREPVKVDLEAALKRPSAKNDLVLEPGDILFVPPARGPRKRFLDYLQQISPVGFLFGAF
jgi:protein involved in polysaccharide export with SLBB domain